MKLTEGVYKVDGARVGNSYLIETGDGLMLVDTGMPGGTKGIAAFVESLGRLPTDVRHIVLTHCDVDHIGSVAGLKALTGASVAIHELDAPVLAGRRRSPKGGAVMALLQRLLRVRHVEPDVLLHDGDSIGGFRVMHVPGHTAGSIALYRDDGVVLSGDALLSDKNGQVLMPRPRLALDRVQAVASAERIKALPATLLLTGHGTPVRF
jgi:glyoxylase-like metal-dependent hydrolase (beta-lactamase superfamily II)